MTLKSTYKQRENSCYVGLKLFTNVCSKNCYTAALCKYGYASKFCDSLNVTAQVTRSENCILLLVC